MRAWVFSDLHLEFGQPFATKPPAGIDLVISAGDILPKGIVPSIRWLADKIGPNIPVIFVAGNHEVYGSFLRDSLAEAVAFAEGLPNFHFLENRSVTIRDVSFIGSSLWTDFRLFGRNPEVAMWAAETGMNDYKRIKFSKRPYQKFKPIHAFRMHMEAMRFIGKELEAAETARTVVITHHAPSAKSIPAEFAADPLSACYASALEDFITNLKPDLWVHGHIHRHLDYAVGSTRIICNARGYPGEMSGFDPALVVDI
jgi:Icc-related predicted phosphoesterase